ncbi:hypothetical protein UH38_15420 [Aliterella atlantica CENA595]|uniref:Phytanoyl-CoA dioxygenase (PhyH) n=1 Tax=Aliterella atlantica CENA595 TaxID=1618023 RepID=A0A0D8ZQI2_9CYAN|nr:hypothetical protein UH38_15420 [Aliterella atlantica CENA595]
MNKKQTQPLFYRGFWSQTKSVLQRYYKRAVKNPQWLLMFVIGRFRMVRSLAAFLAKSSASSYKVEESIFADIDLDTAVRALKEDGCYAGIKLPESVLQEIIEYSRSSPCYGDAEYNMGFLYADKVEIEANYKKQFVRADYFNGLLNCPAIKTIASDPKLLAIASKYMGGDAVVSGSRLWWLFVNETDYDLNKGAYFFHYDLDDYQCLKMFFYITDVSLSDGPHVYVRGSHIKKKLKYLLSLFKLRSDQEIIDYYGEENLIPICGKAGSGFIEDVYCYHKATPPQKSDRLMLQVQFALNDYGNSGDFVSPSLLKNAPCNNS